MRPSATALTQARNSSVSTMRRSFTPIRVLALLSVLLIAGEAQAQQYTITDLGAQLHGSDLNASGHAVGNQSVNGHPIAFRNESGVTTSLGTLGGLESYAMGINSSGRVAGISLMPGNETFHAFVYDNGLMTDIGTLGGAESLGFGINASGAVTGEAQTARGERHAFVYEDGVMRDLGTLGGTRSRGSAINDAGQVAGAAATSGGSMHAFVYTNGVMTDLGTLAGGNESFANDINSAGWVAGYAYTSVASPTQPLQSHAFLYRDGSMYSLGTLGGTMSMANAVDDAGRVVGYSFTEGDSARHAFLYQGDTMLDLNRLIDPTSPLAMYVSLSEAVAINEHGQILVNGTDLRTRQAHSYLLTPVPLPGGVWLLLSGFAGLAKVSRGRARAATRMSAG